MRTLLSLLFSLLLSQAFGQFYRPLHDSSHVQFVVKNPAFSSYYSPNFIQVYPVFESTIDGDSVFLVSDDCTNPYRVWPLGDRFVRHQAPNVYSFVRYSIDTLTLLTDYVLGQSWVCKKPSGGPNVNATFVDKQLYTFGGVTDSVIVIKVGNDTIRISKHYGLCRFANFYHYQESPQPNDTDTLTLAFLSNSPVQQALYKPHDVFDYNQGEVLYYRREDWGTNPNHSGTGYKLIVNTVTSNADTTWYDFIWYEGIHFENGPYNFQLKVMPYSVVKTSGTTFFPELEEMFAFSECDKNQAGLNYDTYSITSHYLDQNPDFEYYHLIGPEMGYANQTIYDTDHGFFRFYVSVFSSPVQVLEFVAGFPTDDPQNDIDMSDLIISGNIGKLSADLQMYPVPCSDQLLISGLPQGTYSAEVSMANGVVIPELQYTAHDNGLLINTSKLAPGIYFIKISEGNDSLMKLFVKQ